MDDKKSLSITTLVVVVVFFVGVGWAIWHYSNLPPITPAERARIDSLTVALQAAPIGTIIEDSLGTFKVIVNFTEKRDWILFSAGKEVFQSPVKDCVEKLLRIYPPQHPDRSWAAERFILQVATQAK